MSSKNKPTRGPDPDTGEPTYEMTETLLYGFRNTDYRDYSTDPDVMATAAAAAARRKELEADPELRRLEAAAKRAETAVKVRAELFKRRAELVRNRLLAEGLTPAVRVLVAKLVADHEKTRAVKS